MLRACLVVASALWLAALLHAQEPAAPHRSSVGSRQSPVAMQELALPAGRIDFTTQVEPILQDYCIDCHDGETRKGGLSLATYADVLEGGRSGAVVRPGASARSLLVERITGAIEPVMPKDDPPLSADHITLLRAWIDEGARLTPTSPPAPQPWDAPLTLTAPAVPPSPWPTWSAPVDAIVATHLTRTAKLADAPGLVSDAVFARRAYLDAWGLLPEPAALQAFIADPAPDKRARLVATLLADRDKYADHWMSFWNDLLRNDDGVNYFSEQNGRRSITPWLLRALRENLRYDRFVAALLNPGKDGPEGFLIGVNWRGETSAAVTPWMQASQNTAQVFLGVNMKCNACHDSFVSRWKLKDAYGLAAFFSPQPKLQLFRCDVAREDYTGPQFLFPEIGGAVDGTSLHDRRAAAARFFTDPRNGRLPRTLVNRLWERLLGRGIVANSDEMDTRPWSPELLDWLASDFVAHDYDVQHLLATIMTSRAYQLPAVPRAAEPSAKDYLFTGPELRRLTAEQFADAIGTLTGEWSTWAGPAMPRPPVKPDKRTGLRIDTDPVYVGLPAREWRAASSTLTRALGRPIRDQVLSARPDDATTPQALELVNGERLTAWLERGARRLTGDLAPDTYSAFNASIAGRAPKARGFDVDVTGWEQLWLIVRDGGSSDPSRVLPVWTQVELLDARGQATPLTALAAASREGLTRAEDGTLHVANPSVLRYDLAGRGFTRLRGAVDVANPRTEIGATLTPSVRFFVFDAAPDLDRLLPPRPTHPLPPPPKPDGAGGLVDRLFWQALGRAPSAGERRLAEQSVADPSRPGRLAPEGVADLLWALLMTPEFQFVR